MTNAHTPGPWEAVRIKLDGNEWSVKSAARNLPPYNWVPRFTVYLKPLGPLSGKYVDATRGMGGNESGICGLAVSENEANARLIAAAPDLLSSLIEVVAIADRKTDAFDRARAAILKATSTEQGERG